MNINHRDFTENQSKANSRAREVLDKWKEKVDTEVRRRNSAYDHYGRNNSRKDVDLEATLMAEHFEMLLRDNEKLNEFIQDFEVLKHTEAQAEDTKYRYEKGDVWFWQESDNHIESMSSSLPVVITAGVLRKLFKECYDTAKKEGRKEAKSECNTRDKY